MFFVVLCTIFLFFFRHYAPRAIFYVGAPTLTGDFSIGRSEKRLRFIWWALGITLGIYPAAARDIAWDLSGGRSGNRLGLFRWPLRRSPSIFGIAFGVSEHVPRHFPFKIPGDFDIRSKAMKRHVEALSSAVIQSRLQRTLARHCVAHREQSYTQPNMFKTILQHVFPVKLQWIPRNTILYTLLCKRFSIKDKTSMACIADYTPSKHEAVGRTTYRNLAICPFPVANAYLSRNARVQLRTKTGLFAVTGFS